MFGINDFSNKIVDFGNFHISQLGDALLFGGAILLIGMVTIFAVLCLLWASLILFKTAFHDLPKKKSTMASPTETADTASVEVSNSSYDNEIVAVIAAAIAMAESESSDTKFKVVSFKRI